jgi:hypothetical protein
VAILAVALVCVVEGVQEERLRQLAERGAQSTL